MVYRLVSSLSLEQAEKIAEGAFTEAKNLSMPLSIVVLDAGGQLVLAKRQDGCGIVRIDVALAKAWGALGMGLPAGTIGERMRENTGFLAGLIGAAKGRMAANHGGVLILDEDENVVGAVGISGDIGKKDEECAIAGIRNANLDFAGA